MRIVMVVAFLATAGLLAPRAWAGSPHFVASCSGVSVVRSGDSLTVSGKEAGLGDEAQVDIEVTATALCINPGSNHPKAANKEAVSAEGEFPVQNGKANFSLTETAVFSPSCDPPMTVEFQDILVCDLTDDVCCSISGTF
jgi:hypothetical protein